MAIVLNGDGALNSLAVDVKNFITVNTSADSSDWWTTPLQGWGTEGDPWQGILSHHQAYGRIYREHLWVNIAVDKLVKLATAPDIAVFRNRPGGRQEANDTAYGRLVRDPNPRHDAVEWWTWMFSTYFIHGFCAAYKARNRMGHVAALHGLHPGRLRYGGPWEGWTFGWEELGLTGDPNANHWWWRRNDGTEIPIPRRDLVIIHNFNPHSQEVGLSKLEPLRSTLENEAAARRANEAMWRNGGKPSFVLKHPGKFSNSPKSVQALADQFRRKHSGVEQWGAPLVLEEGMDALPLQVHNDMQYIDVRQFNATEVLAAYDIPPVAVGLLDRATNNNIEELHKSLYRDTMPPVFKAFQSALEHDLRDGTFGEDRPPEFPPALSAVWNLEEFLRATPEERIKANAQAIQTGQKTIAEVRAEDNRPMIPGTDQLLVNAAITPLAHALGLDRADTVDPSEIANLASKLYIATQGKTLLTIDEARELLRVAGYDISGGVPAELEAAPATPLGQLPPGLGGLVPGAPGPNSGVRPDGTQASDNPGLASPPAATTRALWGHLGRANTLDDLDMADLAIISPPEHRAKVLGAFILVREDGGGMADLRTLLKQLL